MSKLLHEFLSKELQNLEAAGLIQSGVELNSVQGAHVKIGNKEFINFASDDYLGWSGSAELREAAREAIEQYGTCWASGRVASGTHGLHRKLEKTLCEVLDAAESVILPTAYEAHAGIFESLFGEQDYIFCDHSLQPSLVDGVRLSAAKQSHFKQNDLKDLEDKLKRSPNARFRAIVVEGVSPYDGRAAPLGEIAAMAENYEAIVVLDESHGLGVLGQNGRGAAELAGLLGKIDVVTGTFSNALAAGSGGFVAGRAEIISWLRQKSRTYLFSESPAPAPVAAAAKALELLKSGRHDLSHLKERAVFFRNALIEKGFEIVTSDHPIVSVIVGDAVAAQNLVNRLSQKGIYLLGFCYPVVPRGFAQVRFQVTANHSMKDLTEAIEALESAGRQLKIIK